MNPKTYEFYVSIIPLLLINCGLILGYIIFLLMGVRKKRLQDPQVRAESKIIASSLQDYWFTITNPCVRLLIKLGITPNMITLFGLGLSILAGFLFSMKFWGAAGWIMIAGGVFDLFDGKVARMTNNVTKRGGYLDAVIDRYSDGAILGGLIIAFRNHWLLFPLILCFVGFYTVSYTKARAEVNGITCNVGIFQRPERIFSLGLCAIFSPILSYYLDINYPLLIYLVITVLGVGTLITSIYRINYTFKKL